MKLTSIGAGLLLPPLLLPPRRRCCCCCCRATEAAAVGAAHCMAQLLTARHRCSLHHITAAPCLQIGIFDEEKGKAARRGGTGERRQRPPCVRECGPLQALLEPCA